jgi:hypothetical protein
MPRYFPHSSSHSFQKIKEKDLNEGFLERNQQVYVERTDEIIAIF